MHHFLIELLRNTLNQVTTALGGPLKELYSSGVLKGLMLRNQTSATVSLQRQCF